ncbi:MAG TPA: SpoIIE family protein phosphatase [Blastocatellia bacterium]|nr:SpoIIE family protein phosphatase [Blastocatellia bacterium]
MVRRYHIIPVGIFFALILVFSGVNAYEKLFQVRSLPGWLAIQKESRVVVEGIRPDGPASALRPGDQVLALNGEPVTKVAQLELFFRNAEPGARYQVLVARSGGELLLTLRTGPVSLLTWMLLLTRLLVIPAISLLTGLTVFLLKPDDKQATLLALMFGMMCTLFGQAYISYLPFWLNAMLAFTALTTDLLGPVFLHFFLIFPEEKGRVSPMLRRFPRLESWLYLPAVLLILPVSAIYHWMLMTAPARAREFLNLFLLEKAGMFILSAYIVCGLISLIINYRQAGTASRRRLRVVVAGSLIGFLPVMLLFAASFFAEQLHLSQTAWRWFVMLATFAFPIFPLSFAYAIIRHRVIPVSFILRRGVRYVFVSQGSLVLEIIAVALAVNLLLQGILKYVATMDVRVIGILSAIDAILVWNITSELHRRVIAPAIDRRFFRQAYNAQQVLAELGQSLRTMTEKRRMTALATERIQAALHTENAVIFLRDDASGDFICTGATWQSEDASRTEEHHSVTVIAPDTNLILPRDSYTIARFRESSQPLVMDLDDPKSWGHALVQAKVSDDERLSPARQRESETLRRIRPALMLPISTRDQLLGVMSLGPRLGDLPFSREDRHLLTNVAMQIAYAIENAGLIRRKAEEERLRHELLMATEVQQRLFPKCAPELTSLELCGLCHPARGVAGDYYDFIQLDPARVGIAVADVAGKGIAAALLMSTVQASLRSQAIFTSGDPTELVAIMNRLLISSTDLSSYATFFYAQFDELTRRLCYVNAGHNPPILYRNGAVSVSRESGLLRRTAVDSRAATAELEPGAEIREFQMLTTGGPVIGLLENCEYSCETVTLESGDILVAYTDGVTEAFNPHGEEFGEERLRRVIARYAHLSASELSTRIMLAITDWCQDAPQHDDQTLVIARVK